MQFKFLTLAKPSRWPARALYTALYTVLATALLIATAPSSGSAHGLFTPAILVNDDVITYYELDQRTKFLELLRAPGDAKKLAREVLIEERLKKQALAETEIEVSEKEIEDGIAEFATRTQLSESQFIQALNEGGVSRETLRDFVKMGLLWRQYASTEFVADARPSEAEIDRAMGRARAPEISVLLSEIIIPVTPQTQSQAEELAAQISRIRRADEFAAAARRFSAAQTRENGGDLEWLSLAKLPGGLRPMFLSMVPGEVSSPISLPNAIAVFRLRGLREGSVPAPHYTQIDYASYLIPGGRSPEALARAQSVRDRIDACDDLYAIAQGQPAEVLERQKRAPADIPRDVALELAKLDIGETSTALTRNNGATQVLLMLCGRTSTNTGETTREEITRQLTLQRLESLSTAFLTRMEADARIVDK